MRWQDFTRKSWWRWLQVAYFVALALLMWLPIGEVGIDIWTFGLRPDHLVHGLLYLVCPLMLWRWVVRDEGPHWQWLLLWLASAAVAMATEFGQKLLPYRSFDVNDLLANFIGLTIGWVVLRFVARRRI